MQNIITMVYIEIIVVGENKPSNIKFFSVNSSFVFDEGTINKKKFVEQFPASGTILLNVHPFIKESFPNYPFMRMEGTAPLDIGEFKALTTNPISEISKSALEDNEILFIYDYEKMIFFNQSEKLYHGLNAFDVMRGEGRPFVLSTKPIDYDRVIVLSDFDLTFVLDMACSVNYPWSTGPISPQYIDEDVRRFILNSIRKFPQLARLSHEEILKLFESSNQ